MKDGRLAVVHDSNLKRLTGKDVIVENLFSNDLISYPLIIDWQIIPTLDEVLSLINCRVPLLIELKFNDKFNYKQADALLSLLKDYEYKDMIALQSFNYRAVKYLKKTNEYSVGFLSSYRLKNKSRILNYLLKSLKLYNYMHADFIAYDIRFLPNKYVSSKRKNNEQLLTWTINTMQKLKIANFESDNIIFKKIEI